MSNLNWAIVCCLVIFNSAALVAGFNRGVQGAGCNPTSCTSASFIFYECYHLAADLNGAPCRANRCIYNGITHSYCSAGEGDCEFKNDSEAQWVYQSFKWSNCSSASTVTWNPHINTDPCKATNYYETACETSSCSGEEYKTDSRKGRKVCKN